MKNYICINGKKAELTEEQMKALGIEVSKANPFERKIGEYYYIIKPHGEVVCGVEDDHTVDNALYNVANYCTDKAIMEQRALHETLNRLLWRYSMEHDGDKIDWENDDNNKWCICYNYKRNCFGVDYDIMYNVLTTVYFYNREIAEAAIEEIIEPFIEAHPEFKW